MINRFDLITLEAKLDKLLRRDTHSNGSYLVSSLYFDNFTDRAVFEKLAGFPRREKWRIRYYETNLDYIQLEKKIRINSMVKKIQHPIAKENVQVILDNPANMPIDESLNLLKSSPGQSPDAGALVPLDLYSKIRNQNLRPKQIVRYRREAWTYPGGNVRITLDHDLETSNQIQNFLQPGTTTFIPITKYFVLEVKFDHFLPEFVQKAIVLPQRNQSEFSKYIISRIAI
jgi:hypothetical protein